MTTIACDRTTMAADSLVTCSGSRNCQTAKIWRHHRSIFGACGDCPAIAKFRRWVEAGMPQTEVPTFDDDADLGVLELRPDGIYIWDVGLFPDRLEDAEQNYATGSIGAGVALYAMRVLNMSPADAMREACRVDTESGAPVRYLTLDGTGGTV